jgi:hypothetical protein
MESEILNEIFPSNAGIIDCVFNLSHEVSLVDLVGHFFGNSS